MEKKRILFVDDEENVLLSIQRIFFDMEDEWDMVFAKNGKDALQHMKEKPFDVIISDMRMPEMDGAELLSRVKELYPQTIRFILSGYSDKEMILRTVGPADQFLTKPCDPEIVKKTIEDAFAAQHMIDKKHLRSIVSSMHDMPTLPRLYIEVKEALESEKSSFQDIAKVIQKDIPITAKVLQLVNSAFFGLRNRIENLQMALTYLGIETLKAVILTTDVFSKFTQSEMEQFDIDGIYRHSIFVSMLSRNIAQTVTADKKMHDVACMAGMLHDIGKLIFIRSRPEVYATIVQRVKEEGRPLFEFEKETFEITHADIGGYLMSTWGLPEDVVSAISLHHNPVRALRVPFDSLTIVYMCNMLAHEHMRDAEYGSVTQEIDKGYLTKLDLMKYLPEWRKIAKIVKEMEEKENGQQK